MEIHTTTDPVTRYVYVQYDVPQAVPDEIAVGCEMRTKGDADWRPAPVYPHVSETALNLIRERQWLQGVQHGKVVERRAAGLRRTLVWNPFRQLSGRTSAELRITLQSADEVLEQGEAVVGLDNGDVMILHDWRQVMQQECVSEDPAKDAPVWWYRTGQYGEKAPAGGTSLEARSKNVELPQLTYPLDLHGPYAIFVSLPAKLGCIGLRLSGDERVECFGEISDLATDSVDLGTRLGTEEFWRWVEMDRQHLVIVQPFGSVFQFEEDFRARLDTVRLVPLTADLARQLDKRWRPDAKRRLVNGYQEPYGWAFTQKVESNLQHREHLLAFAEANLDRLDIQTVRGGSVTTSETRVGTQQLGTSQGDPVRGVVPYTSNVGRMQQYTNTLQTEFKYARALGIEPRANMGATACYTGTTEESEFSKEHPEWQDDGCLRYEVPEVRQYLLALYEEMLEIGARSLSIDWCRYPHAIKSKDTIVIFLRELRALADRFTDSEGGRVDILVRFPVWDEPSHEHMDYVTWVREGLVDYLCPSNIYNRPFNFSLDAYVEAVKGTPVVLLPNVEAFVPLPGMWFQRLLECYERGVQGVYIYQTDATVSNPRARRYVSLAGSMQALQRWRRREAQEQARYSKSIYISIPHRGRRFQPYERLRVWVEGIDSGTVELWLDGARTNRYEAPPYILVSENLENDRAISPGHHTLKVRAQDGDGWLEQEFEVEYG